MANYQHSTGVSGDSLITALFEGYGHGTGVNNPGNFINKGDPGWDENSVKQTKELEGKISKKKMPHDLVVFVNFETGAKYERFINGGGSGAPEKLQAIQEIASRMIDGRLFIISIDPRIKKS